MGDKIINHNLHLDHQESEAAVETLSLSNFPLSPDHRNPSSSSSSSDSDELFEFFRGGLSDYSEEKTMSHAEDIISCGKLIPINEQLHRKNQPEQIEKYHRINQLNYVHPLGCRRSRSYSRSDVKTTTATSLDYKTLKRSSTMRSEPAAGSGKKSSPSRRWHVVLFGLVNVPPPEMDIRDLKNRQYRGLKTPVASAESGDVFPVNRSFDRRRCSWRVLEFLSCRSVGSAAVTSSLGYMAKV